jgi:hypothetical protein
MSPTLERQNAVTTLQTAAGWLRETPALVGLFFVLALLNATGQLTGLVSILGSLTGSLLGLVFAGIAHVVAADRVADRAPDLAENAEAVVRRLLALVAIAIVAGILTFVATLFFIIPGIYVSLRLSLAPAACIIDDMTIGDSLSESWEVAQGNLLKLLGIELATGLVSVSVLAVLVVATGSGAALTEPGNTALFVPFLLLSPVTAIVAPITQLAIARVYLENRKNRDTDENGGPPTDDDLTVQPGDDEWETSADSTDESADSGDEQADHSDDDQDNYWDDR